jgi:hypothetical protein
MPRLLRLFFLLIASVAHAGIPSPPPTVRKAPKLDLEWFYAAIKEADAMEFHEGLPHPFFEPKERASELTRVETKEIRRELFYVTPLLVREESQVTISRTFLDESIYDQSLITMVKTCGGFHADFAISWLKEERATVTALVCLGCAELQLLGEKSRHLDLSETGHATLRTLLKPLQSQRPPWLFEHRLRNLKKHLGPIEPPVLKIELNP